MLLEDMISSGNETLDTGIGLSKWAVPRLQVSLRLRFENAIGNPIPDVEF